MEMRFPERSVAPCRQAFRLQLFRQAIVYKNRNRDTAWYGMIDAEWQGIRAAFDTWLDPSNFDADGNQKIPLAARRDFGTN